MAAFSVWKHFVCELPYDFFFFFFLLFLINNRMHKNNEKLSTQKKGWIVFPRNRRKEEREKKKWQKIIYHFKRNAIFSVIIFDILTWNANVELTFFFRFFVCLHSERVNNFNFICLTYLAVFAHRLTVFPLNPYIRVLAKHPFLTQLNKKKKSGNGKKSK